MTKRIWPPLLPLLVLVLALLLPTAQAMRSDRVAELRRETVKMFYHGFDNYMRVAFPEDELRPVSCVPLTRDNLNPRNIELNDVLGNYSLTLIDSLSTLAILASAPPEDGDTGAKALKDFQDGVAALVQQYGNGRPGPSGAGQRGRGFDMDSKVQVFETVIRGVGGLLSAHLFAVGELPIRGYTPPTPPAHPDEQQQPILWSSGFTYDGQLLRLALDLATRLLPAFYTATGMPYPRVNLRHGIPFYSNSPLNGGSGTKDGDSESDLGFAARRKASGPLEITETCSAGAGSLVLEFTVLSRLTGDQRFEQLAKRAFWAVWYRRSDIGLIGAGLDAEQGRWIGAYSVIGAGADSFFEYALKTHILLSGHELPNRTSSSPPPAHHLLPLWTQDETTGLQKVLAWHDPNAIFPVLSEAENSPDSFLEAWHLAHAAIKRHLYSDREHPHYVNVNIWTGSLAAQWIDSLGAYYSGLLILAGEVDEAIETNLLYTAVWAKYAALPERWSVKDRTVEGGLGWWPLRPEFIESVYHIYRATKDPWYLYVGEMVQRDIKRRCWTSCGWAGLQNVLSGEMSDRMESFFLGETAKYMYLLYDERHPMNSLDAAYVFTTEGHPLIIPKHHPSDDDRNKKANENDKHSNDGDRKRKSKIKQASSTSSGEHDAQASDHPTTHSHSGIPGVPQPDQGPDDNIVGVYNDGGFTNTCPLPPKLDLFTGSAITARGDLYHAAKMVDLHLMVFEDDEDRIKASLDNAYFPWTLPASLLPQNGTSTKVHQPTEMSLEFSAQPHETQKGGGSGGSLFNALPAGSANFLYRMAPNKIRVNSISGLKLVFRLEEEHGERSWRVTRVNGVPMGRDESVVVDRALINHISDPRFAMVRDPVVAKLHHLHQGIWMEGHDGEAKDAVIVILGDEDEAEKDDSSNHSTGSTKVDANEKNKSSKKNEDAEHLDDKSSHHGHGLPHNHHHRPPEPVHVPPLHSENPPGLTTLVKSFWRQIVSSLDGPAHATPAPGSQQLEQSRQSSQQRRRDASGTTRNVVNVVLNLTGVTPTGLGAAPLPPVDIPAGAVIPAAGPVPLELLPWRSVYAGGLACGENMPLPETAVRDHQVLVLRRGGCSFSEKLANVPSFAASPRRLQLVVIVSDDEEILVGRAAGDSPTFHSDAQDFVRPLLDVTQRTPGGLVRWQPLAMIMVGGGDDAYRQLAEARQLGLTRRYGVESQGVRIHNVIIDDGDDL